MTCACLDGVVHLAGVLWVCETCGAPVDLAAAWYAAVADDERPRLLDPDDCIYCGDAAMSRRCPAREDQGPCKQPPIHRTIQETGTRGR